MCICNSLSTYTPNYLYSCIPLCFGRVLVYALPVESFEYNAENPIRVNVLVFPYNCMLPLLYFRMFMSTIQGDMLRALHIKIMWQCRQHAIPVGGRQGQMTKQYLFELSAIYLECVCLPVGSFRYNVEILSGWKLSYILIIVCCHCCIALARICHRKEATQADVIHRRKDATHAAVFQALPS